MPINPATWPSLSQWSKLKITYFCVYFEFIISSKALNLIHLDEGRIQRLELMSDLRMTGLMFREVAELMNLMKIRTPTNKMYSAKLVERSLVKYQRREIRKEQTSLKVVKETYEFNWG